jgi:hypothetical protein
VTPRTTWWRSPATTVVLVSAGLLVAACGDDEADTTAASTATATATATWTAWDVTVERPAEPADVGPLCLQFDGGVSGIYTEYEAPDGQRGVAVFDLAGDPAAIAELGDLYRNLGECADESLRIELISESAASVAWRVEVITDDQSGDAGLVGFVADGDRARVVTGLESTWTDLGGGDAWAL